MPAVWGKLRRLERIAEVGDFRLPSQASHFYPTGGFNPLFEKMLDGFDVRYGVQVHHVEIEDERPQVVTNTSRMPADLVIVTAPIDVVFGFCYGPLEWRGYRIEIETVRDADRARLGVAPDGVPFSWVYTPWAETPICRTTDFGVIHHGHREADRPDSHVVLREIVDAGVRMYPVWWENERFYKYLAAATRVHGVVPLGGSASTSTSLWIAPTRWCYAFSALSIATWAPTPGSASRSFGTCGGTGASDLTSNASPKWKIHHPLLCPGRTHPPAVPALWIPYRVDQTHSHRRLRSSSPALITAKGR